MSWILVTSNYRIYDFMDFKPNLKDPFRYDVKEVTLPEGFNRETFINYLYFNDTFYELENENPKYDEISKLKYRLSETDYVVTKIAESTVSGVTFSEEDAARYSEIITERNECRTRIGVLEKEIEDIQKRYDEIVNVPS